MRIGGLAELIGEVPFEIGDRQVVPAQMGRDLGKGTGEVSVLHHVGVNVATGHDIADHADSSHGLGSLGGAPERVIGSERHYAGPKVDLIEGNEGDSPWTLRHRHRQGVVIGKGGLRLHPRRHIARRSPRISTGNGSGEPTSHQFATAPRIRGKAASGAI